MERKVGGSAVRRFCKAGKKGTDTLTLILLSECLCWKFSCCPSKHEMFLWSTRWQSHPKTRAFCFLKLIWKRQAVIWLDLSVLTEELILQVLKVVCWAAGSSSHCFLLPLLQMSNFFQQFLPQFGDFSLICCDLWRFKHSSLSLPLSQCAASVQQSLLSIKLIKVAHWLLAKHLVSFSFVIFSLKKKWSYIQC